MSFDAELREWLNRADKDFITNLKFGIKVWYSIDYVPITKYEIITEEFCNNLTKLRKSYKFIQEYQQAWLVINEFLQLKCSPGSISASTKGLLVDALMNEAKRSRKNPMKCVCEGLQILFNCPSMQNYYKSNVQKYAAFIGDILKYYVALIKRTETHSLITFCHQSINQTITEIIRFVDTTPLFTNFRGAFIRYSLVTFTELVVLLHHHLTDIFDGWRLLLKNILCNGKKSLKFQMYFDNINVESDVHCLFIVPHYTCLMVIDVILITHKDDLYLMASFLKFLFQNHLRINNGIYSNATELLQSATYIIHLLKIYDIHLNSLKVDKKKALDFLGNNLLNIFNSCCNDNLYEAMRLICETLRLNPMILEHLIFPIIVCCMTSSKNKLAMKMLEELLCLTIDVYKRLGRPEKFISQLMKSINNRLETTKLSKNLKRIISSSKADKEIPAKKSLIAANGDQTPVSLEDSKSYLRLMLSHTIQRKAEFHSIEKVSLDQWSSIEFAWPANVGYTFSKFVSCLLSKPSLTMWKALTFNLTECINTLKDEKLDENALFKIEYVSLLLSQYFFGCRLAEQSNQMWNLIDTNRQLTRTALKKFGLAILNQEHNSRTMNAFLQVCFNIGNFDILCGYYCPDSWINNSNSEILSNTFSQIDVVQLTDGIYSYLLPQEWTLIEQRITNFGKEECRINLSKLYLQKLKCSLLFTDKSSSNFRYHLLTSTLSDLAQVTKILTDASLAVWFVSLLSRDELIELANLILTANEKEELLQHCRECVQFMEIVSIVIFKHLQTCFESKKSVLNGIDFVKILQSDNSDINDVIQLIRNHTFTPHVMIKYSDNDIRKYLTLLNSLTLKFFSQDIKNYVFLLSVSLYWDVKSTGNSELIKMCSSLITELVYFGYTPKVSGLFTISDLQNIFTIKDLPIYEIIFESITKNLNAENIKMLNSLLVTLKNSEVSEQTIIISITVMEKLSKDKKHKNLFVQFRNVLIEKIKYYFSNEHSTIKIENFALKTLAGFTTILEAIISNPENIVDDALKLICDKYLKNTIVYNNSSSLKLLSIMIINKDILDLPAEQIKILIDNCWQNYINTLNVNIPIDVVCSESLLKLIFTHKSNIELVNLFADLLMANPNDSCVSLKQYKLFNEMAKLLLNKTKGSIFLEAFKQISIRTIMKISTTDNKSVFVNFLNCQKLIAANIHFTVSVEFIDDILMTLAELNIRKFIVTEDNMNPFLLLHGHMSDVCNALIQHRHVFIVTRIPQFTAILKDLIESICSYKCLRQKDKGLNSAELKILAELCHQVENVVKILVKHKKDIKRVAPYFLIFILHLITSTERPTTLYPKIKMPIESICYNLISVCDHRVEGFIFRNCNEAMKPIYEQLLKDFGSYHKFKGKV